MLWECHHNVGVVSLCGSGQNQFISSGTICHMSLVCYVHVELAGPQMWQKRNALGETGNKLRSHDSSILNARKCRHPQ